MRAKKTIKIVLTILLLSYITYYIINNLDEFLKLKHVTVFQLIQMYVVSCLLLSIIGTRLLIIMREYGLSKIRFVEWTRIFILARFFNYFIPQVGSIYRAVKLKQDYGFTYLRYVTSFLAFIWTDVITILFIVTVVFFLFESKMLLKGVPIYFLSLFFLVVAILAPLILSLLAKSKINESSRLFKLFSKYNKFINIIGSPPLFVKQWILSMLSFVLYVLLFYLCATSIYIEIPISILVIFSAIIKLSTYIVITPGNIGIIEIALGYLSVASNLDFGDGIMIAGISRIIIYLSTITMGCFLGGVPMLKELQKVKANHKDNNNL